MLVYPAASELNTQPVHKIHFINALSLPDAFHLKFLAFSRPITDGRGCRSVVFFIYIFVSTYFVLCTSDALQRLISFVVINFLIFFSFVYRHSQNAIQFSLCLACNNFASAQTHRNVSRSPLLSRFASRSLCSLILVRYIFILTLRYLFFLFVTLLVLACICIFVRFVPRRLNVSPCFCAL